MGMLDKFLDIMRLTADDDYDDEYYDDYEEEPPRSIGAPRNLPAKRMIMRKRIPKLTAAQSPTRR